MYVYFYLNKVFKLFILLKEIIIIIKTHIKLMMNMYNLFSKFYCRKTETTCDRELKIQQQNVWTQNRVLKITMIHQYKVELQERILKKNIYIYTYIKRKRIPNFSRENVRENNKKFIENNMRRKKVRIKNIAIVRTSFGLDPKQDWVLAQQAQTINL